MKRPILTSIFFLFTFFLNAQLVLRGKVTAGDTKQPIPLANVFLSNTSIGTVTEKDGSFAIHNFPHGRYDVVVSCIGYEIEVITIQTSAMPPALDIVLKPKVNVLQEVVVEPYEKNGWEKYGTFFMEQFVGTSALASDCKLRNPQVIKFRYSKKENKLRAYADEPILFENRALGYILKYDIKMFEYSYNTRVLVFMGYPLFEDMNAKRKRIETRWVKNREEAFKGSLMHFMRAVYRNKLVENGFEIRRLMKVSVAERNRVTRIVAERQEALNTGGSALPADSILGSGNKDSGFYYRVVMQNQRMKEVLFPHILNGDSIAYGLDSFTAGLQFRNSLHVIYKYKQVPYEYAQQNPMTVVPRSPITSHLELPNGKTISIFSNGTFYEGVEMLTQGYWSWWEKLATMLPYDYVPISPELKKNL